MPRGGVIGRLQSRRDRMAAGETSNPIHPVRTRTGKQYLFSDKHHGLVPDAAQWLRNLSREDEFAIFVTADNLELSDDRGRLYGLRRNPEGRILKLGTRDEQVAEFPFARRNEPWHGYPIYPLREAGPENRQGEKHRPSRDVFLKMVAAGLLQISQMKRLMKGHHV